MRPRKLTVSALGPYAREQVFDFRLLADRSLFLIHGPTGSGKTSILDAMCYALYAKTSGGERDFRQMRSGHAPADLMTEVTFDFALGDEAFRVHRRPEQERPRKKGSGMAREPSAVTLWRRTGLTSDAAEGTVIADRSGAVDEAVKGLLGFEYEQFKQVVMLPQGQFRELLLAGSAERQMILEALFQTEVYRRIEEALKGEAKAIRAKAEALDAEKNLVLRQAGAESEAELLGARDGLARRLAELTAALEALRAREAEAGRCLDQGRQIVMRTNEWKQAEASHAALEGRKDEIEDKERRLARGRRASDLKDLEANRKARAKELAEASFRLEGEQRNFAHAKQEKAREEEALAREQSREKEREEERQLLGKLREMTGRVFEIEQAERGLAAARVERERKTAARDGGKAGLDEIQRSLLDARASHGPALQVAALVESRRAAVQEAERVLARSEQLVRLRKEIVVARGEHERAGARLESAVSDLARAREKKEAIEAAWIGGQAAILARVLVPGVPCPVCGSTEHPALARAERDLPAEEVLKKAREEAKGLEAKHEEARKAVDRAGGERIGAESQVRTIEEELGAMAGEDPAAAAAEKLKEARRQAGEAEASRKLAAELTARIEGLERQEGGTRTDLAQAEQGLVGAAVEVGKLEAVVREKTAQVPENLRTVEALEKAIGEAERRRKLLADALAGAQAKAVEATSEEARRAQAERAQGEAVIVARERAGEAGREFEVRLREAGFESEPDFQMARIEPVRMDALDGEIRGYEAALGAARERVRRAREALADQAPPDMEVLEEALRKAKGDLDSANRERGGLDERIEQMEGWIGQVRSTAREIAAEEQRYAVVGRIAEVANGENGLGITFERFVLASLLDDVLAAATQRLRLMSRGRFDLSRALDRADRRSAGGLDLQVSDTYTGTTRPVNTLSGGESFLAALSLALGLADVVQAYAGGIKLDTIFVDEGFGSLDPESLDLAFRALVDLQRAGRLVGVISHVPELKERIDARLEVVPGKLGSVARFVL